MDKTYDAILIPGGGVTPEGTPTSWVIERLLEAIKYDSGKEHFITMSAGTTHKPHPLNEDGFPIFESVAGARYLIQQGVNPENALVETSSYDTIGNAYFSRVVHIEPRNFNNLLIITNEFHIPRTKAIFEWIYRLGPSNNYSLDFKAVKDVGIEKTALKKRIEKENQGLENVLQLKNEISTLEDFHKWLFKHHKAYARCHKDTRIEGKVLDSY